MALIKPDLNKPCFQLPMFAHMKIQIASGFCPMCLNEIREEDFREEKNKREYTLSGMCQKCQDKTF